MKIEQVMGIIRHILTFVGGVVVAKGLVDETLITEIIGGTLTLIGGIWSIISKNKTKEMTEQGMKLIINENKLSDTFKNIMSEYSDIEPILNFHEYMDNGQYFDQETLEFYLDEELDYEDNEWIFTYIKDFEGDDDPDKYPMLNYYAWKFEPLIRAFGESMFQELLKKWFEDNYGLKVVSVQKS